MSEHSKDSANKSELVEDLDTPDEAAENIKGGASRPRVRPDHKAEVRPDVRAR
jgi:hypothetical protein